MRAVEGENKRKRSRCDESIKVDRGIVLRLSYVHVHKCPYIYDGSIERLPGEREPAERELNECERETGSWQEGRRNGDIRGQTLIRVYRNE